VKTGLTKSVIALIDPDRVLSLVVPIRPGREEIAMRGSSVNRINLIVEVRIRVVAKAVVVLLSSLVALAPMTQNSLVGMSNRVIRLPIEA